MGRTLYFTVSTAGHVDHGKTSVLRALTGIDPDRLKEEKQRQMTTDLGFAHLELDGTGDDKVVVGFIDVPGHGKFLKNMLAGVGGIDMALLVVAADEGPMPQTVAHVKILSLLGVGKALVILTKTDIAPEPMPSEAIAAIDELLARYRVERVGLVKVACPQQTGFAELKSTLKDVVLQSITRTSGDDDTPVYLPIDRVFSKSGYGVVITGTLVRGRVKAGDNLFVQPGNLKARVRGLETFGRTLQAASSGQRLAINLSFREHVTLSRGQAILGNDFAPSSTLIVQFQKTESVEDSSLEKTLVGQDVRLYHGTAECAGSVRWIESAGETLIGQITLTDPVVAEPGDRFVTRYGEQGITGGVILTTARPRWLTRPRLMDLAHALVAHDNEKAVGLFLDACPQRTVRSDVLSCLLPLQTRIAVVNALLGSGSVTQLADYLVTRESMAELSTKLIQVIKIDGTAGDTSKQSSSETLRSKVLPGIDRSAFQALVKVLSDSGQLVRKGDQLLLPQQAAQKQPDNSELENKILSILAEHWCLEIDELAKQLGRDRKEIIGLLGRMNGEFKASVVNYDFAGTSEKIEQAHKLLVPIWHAKKDISPADFRDALGTTRKYAMALLAHFDDNGVTRRTGTARVLLKNPKSATSTS